MSGEEKLLLSKCEDLFSKCDKYQMPCFSQFLNETERAFIEKEVFARVGYNCSFFGGYNDAKRTVFGVFPEWQEVNTADYPIKVIEITKKYKKELTHRDYLGTVLSKGIERSKVGDILVDGDKGYILIASDIADYISSGIDKIANVGVKSVVREVENIVPPEQKFQTINIVGASQRLDAIVSAVLKISRNNASELIRNAKVNVNHLPVLDVSFGIKQGDIISVRGFGRFYLSEVGNRTRSDRLHMEIKKYL